MPEERISPTTPGGVGRSLSRERDPERVRGFVNGAVLVGVVLCLVLVIIGLRMALHATVVTCPNGTEFPPHTTDFRCFARRHAGVGTALVIVAALFGIVLSLAGTIARALLPPIGKPAAR